MQCYGAKTRVRYGLAEAQDFARGEQACGSDGLGNGGYARRDGDICTAAVLE
jgi:hypothetical protein